MMVMVVPIVNFVLGTIPRELVMGLEDLETRRQVECTQTTALLISARIQRVVLSWILEETCCHSNSSEEPSANAGVKNSQRGKIITH